MRKMNLLAGLFVLGLVGIAGKATLGTAQPGPAPPIIEPIQAAPALPPIPSDITPGEMRTTRPSDPALPIPDATGNPPAPVRLTPETIQIPGDNSKAVVPEPKFAESTGHPIASAAPEQTMRADAGMSSTEPAIKLEWTGPSAVKVGVPVEFVLTVRNIATIPVQKVIVQVRAPVGATILGAEPKAEGSENVLVWELGNMFAKQERKLSLKLVSTQRGDLPCQAWVTFTGSSVIKMHVREPKLAVKVVAPERVVVGDPTNVIVNISNPGDYATERVKVTANLGEGLECGRGNNLSFDLGTLAPGETRSLTMPCVTKTAGPQKCDAFVEADGGLKANDSFILNVIQPRIELALVGPKLRYLDHKAIYTLRVTNPGDAPTANVFVAHAIPTGFKFVQADNGGQLDDATRSVKWFIGDLGAGQVKEMKCELMASVSGEFTHKAIAYASRGMKAEQELNTAVEGLAAILMEVVDTEDPVEVGGDTAYEIKITNTGTKAESAVNLICTIPPQMKLKSIQAPVKYEMVGNDIVFQTLPRLSPRADVVFKINVTAVMKGDARFKASLTTGSLIEPVIKVEPTKVYSE
jgi:uncharacterized repeat protein (TIGR01451 family)